MTEQKITVNFIPNGRDPDSRDSIEWDAPMLRRFERALVTAKTGEIIVFDGREFLVAYGRILAEHLRSQLGNPCQ